MSAHAQVLTAHLDRLATTGRTISAWWRDDDAIAATPALDKLLGIASDAKVPVALAVIPGRLHPSLPERLQDDVKIDILVHGLTHANHAPAGQKPAEFGPHRPIDALEAELGRARALTRAAFGTRALDMFVPPWNRHADELPEALARTGFRALSAFGGALARDGTVAGIPTHLDPVGWHGGGSLIAPERLDEQLRRTLDDATHTFGVLTHHLAFDDVLWSFTRQMLQVLSSHPALSWKAARQLL